MVVATAFVTEAMSKSVVGLTSTSPPFDSLRAGSCRKERDKGGAPLGAVCPAGPTSFVRWPNALSATTRSLWVTETEAAGKARVAIASFKTEKADEKMLS